VTSLFSRWRRRVVPQPVTDGRAPVRAQARPERVEIEVFTADGSGRVGIDLDADRMTDLLNHASHLLVWDRAAPGGEPVELVTDAVLLVIPPVQLTDHRRRLHRLRQALRIRIGPYAVTGHLHVPPGAQAGGYLMRINPRFVPLTDAIIEHAGPEPVARRADVLLVNLHQVEVLKEISEEDAVPNGAA